MNRKIKLAVVRNNKDDICPFGLNIPQACINAGNSVLNMIPLESRDAHYQISDEDRENAITNNNKIYKDYISTFGNVSKCKYMSSILEKFNSVDCNYDEPNDSNGLDRSLGQTPSRLFYGGINGIQTYPPGVLSDNYDISRNLYYGVFDSVYTEASEKTNNNALLKDSVFLSEEQMELISEAKMLDDIVVEEIPSIGHELPIGDDSVFMYSDKPSEELVLDMHSPFGYGGDHNVDHHADNYADHVSHDMTHAIENDGMLDEAINGVLDINSNHHESDGHINVVDVHGDINITLPRVPGAPEDVEDIIVEDEADQEGSENDSEDNQQAKDKKKSKWDWQSKDHKGFLPWIKDRVDDVPKHSGKDLAGLDRAIAYLEKLDAEISKAMRLDLDGALDANKIEEVREKIEEGIDRLEDRVEKLKQSKKTRKKSSEFEPELVKEAQKAMGVKGVMVTVPLFISHLGRVIMNGMISGGHDAEDIFRKLSKKYKLTDREKAELIQYLEDSNMPIRIDRGYDSDESFNESSSDNFDWSAQYKS
jgi:hypothetical protein